MSLFSFSRFITSLNYLCETISVTQRVASGLWETRTAYPSRALVFCIVFFFFFGLVCFLFALGYVHNIAYISGLPILDCPFSFLERCFTIRLSLDVLSYTCLPPLLVFYSYISRQPDLDRGKIFASYYKLTDEIPWWCVGFWNCKHLRWVPGRDDSRLGKCISM